VASLLTAIGPSPAQAFGLTWSLTDNFENNPAASWWSESDADGYLQWGGHDGLARSGVDYAEVYRFVQGWSSADRAVTLPYQAVAAARTCTLAGYVQELVGTRFNVEVIDPTSWTYLALGVFTLPDTFVWHQYSVSWTGGPSSVVLRFVVVSNGNFARIKVDDVTVQCVF